jgi:hypothetical protein
LLGASVDESNFFCTSLHVIFFNYASINGDRFAYFYMFDKHEDRYSGLLCTLYFLDGNNVFAVFGLFIIGQLCVLAGFKSFNP